MNAIRHLICLLFTLILAVTSAEASGLKTECKAVAALATLEHSPNLIVSLARDYANRTCYFYVGGPPPQGVKDAVASWFSAKLDDKLTDANVISNVLRSIASTMASSQAIPESKLKDVDDTINKNGDFIARCAKMRQAKQAGTDKSNDGRMQCTVPKDGEYLEFRVSANSVDLAVRLPTV